MAELDMVSEHLNASSNLYDVENPSIPLVSPLKMELEKLSPPSSECCIYSVPKMLRESNHKAYTPQIVSIGPVHYIKEGSKIVNKLKLRCLQKFLEWTNISCEDATKFVKERERKIRSCYAQTFDFDDYGEEFVEMVLLDAAFVTVILIDFRYPDLNEGPLKEYFFDKTGFFIADIRMDMMMLENQLPFFLIADLFELAIKNLSSNHQQKWDSIYEIMFVLFELEDVNDSLPKDIESYDIKHFLDFIRYCYLPSKPLSPGKATTISIPNVTMLHNSGVRFKRASGGNMGDMRFTNGVLEIPLIKLASDVQVLLGNLLAFERYHYMKDLYINEYLCILGILVESSKDVDILSECQIMFSNLGNRDESSAFFANFNRVILLDTDNFHFPGLCKDLNDYCQPSRRRWMATLKQEYFKNPWKSMSVIAAVILLVLTLIQTVCSIISVP